MNLKLTTLISTISLSLSGITSSAPIPSICNDFMVAGNESIEIFAKIKQAKPESAAVIDAAAAQIQNSLATLKASITEASDDQIPAISNACKNGAADIKTMNKTLRKSLSQN